MKHIISLFIFIFAFAPIYNATTSTTTDVLTQADSMYLNREKKNILSQSITLLSSTLEKNNLTNTEKYEVNWRLARHYAFIADDVVPDYKDLDKNSMLKLFFKAEDYAKEAITLNPKRFEGYYWKGVLLGKTAEYRGILESLFAVGPIKESMENVIKINPNFPGAYYVLARLHRKAPKFISVGNIKLAEKNAKKAVELKPTSTRYLLELGKIYLKRNKKKEAKAIFNNIISMDNSYSDFQPDVDNQKKEAASLLEKL